MCSENSSFLLKTNVIGMHFVIVGNVNHLMYVTIKSNLKVKNLSLCGCDDLKNKGLGGLYYSNQTR